MAFNYARNALSRQAMGGWVSAAAVIAGTTGCACLAPGSEGGTPNTTACGRTAVRSDKYIEKAARMGPPPVGCDHPPATVSAGDSHATHRPAIRRAALSEAAAPASCGPAGVSGDGGDATDSHGTLSATCASPCCLAGEGDWTGAGAGARLCVTGCRVGCCCECRLGDRLCH